MEHEITIFVPYGYDLLSSKEILKAILSAAKWFIGFAELRGVFMFAELRGVFVFDLYYDE